MNKIEDLLERSGSAKPRRTLRADFTSNITEYLGNHPPRRGFAHFLEVRFMNLFTKPVIAVAAIVATLVIGGTAFAAVGWPTISAIFGGQQKLDSGGRIVRVDTQNCVYPSAFTVTSKDQKENVVYYKVKGTSKLTNDQVVQIVRGNCLVQQQATFDMNTIESTLNTNPLNKDHVIGGYIDSVVTAISSSSISLRSVVPINRDIKTINQTFTHIAPDVLVYSSPNKLQLSDIKVGDHVSIKYRASGDALTHSETLPLDQVDTNDQTIVAIIKNTPDMTAAVDYQKYNMSDFEQVTPCTTQASGYCTIDQINQ